MFDSHICPKQTCYSFFLDTPDAVPDYTPLSLLKRQAEDLPATVHTVSSETPLGRRGRLANLAATIGSWEDDLSHAHIANENAKDKPSKAVPKAAVRAAEVAAGPVVVSSTASSKTTSSLNQVGLPGIVLFFSVMTYFCLTDI